MVAGQITPESTADQEAPILTSFIQDNCLLSQWALYSQNMATCPHVEQHAVNHRSTTHAISGFVSLKKAWPCDRITRTTEI